MADKVLSMTIHLTAKPFQLIAMHSRTLAKKRLHIKISSNLNHHRLNKCGAKYKTYFQAQWAKYSKEPSSRLQNAKGSWIISPMLVRSLTKGDLCRPHCKKRSNPARHSEWEGLLMLMKGSFLCVFPYSVSNSSRPYFDGKVEKLLQSNTMSVVTLWSENLFEEGICSLWPRKSLSW